MTNNPYKVRVPSYGNIQSHQRNAEEELGTQTLEHVCVFFIAVGVSVGFTCVLAAVNYFAIALFHDRMEFLYLCCAVYFPSLPVVLLQLYCDRSIDRNLGTGVSYDIRAFVYFSAMAMIMFYLPLGPASSDTETKGASDRQLPLLLSVTFLGFFSALSYGTFFQMVCFLEKGKKKVCTAIFSSGYQGSGIIALILSEVIGFRTLPSDFQVKAFFWSAAVLELWAGVCYGIMRTQSKVFGAALTVRDREATEYFSRRVSRAATPKIGMPTPGARKVKHLHDVTQSPANEKTWLFSKGKFKAGVRGSSKSDDIEMTAQVEELNGSSSNNLLSSDEDELSELQRDWLVFKEIAPCVIAVFINIFASVFLLPFYPFFPSSWRRLPQILFFTKLLSDTAGRPLTIICPPIQNQYTILLASIIRVCSLSIFFFNILGYVEWHWLVTISLVGGFSLASGFIGTSAYQLAPSRFEKFFDKSQVANMLNFSFHFAVAVALIASTVVTWWVNKSVRSGDVTV